MLAWIPKLLFLQLNALTEEKNLMPYKSEMV